MSNITSHAELNAELNAEPIMMNDCVDFTKCVIIDESVVDMLYSQSPVSCTRELIRIALQTTQNNMMEALDLLWEIPKPPPKPFKFLDDVREIADACDAAMEEQDMKKKYFKNVS